MNYKEYGSTNARTILLLHGGGLSWWNYREEAELLKNEYHMIVPILDGHAGSDKARRMERHVPTPHQARRSAF